MKRKLDNIIKESIRNVLIEMDLVPVDKHGEVSLVNKQSVNAWKLLYNLMDNVKTKMDVDWQSKNGSMTNKDIEDVIEYINTSIQGIKRNTIE